MQVMNVTNNGYSNNNHPAFGTTAKLVENLPNKLLAHHEDVAPVLGEIKDSLDVLKVNGQLNDLKVSIEQVKFKGKQFIQMSCKLFGADKKGLSREVLADRGIDLFEYNKKDASVKPAFGLADVVRKAVETKTGQKPEVVTMDLVKDNAYEILPTYYNRSLNPNPVTKITEKGLDPLWKRHEKASGMFKKLDVAIENLKANSDNGLLKTTYKVKSAKRGLNKLVMHMELYSATKSGPLGRIHSGVDVPLFEFDKAKNIVKSKDSYVIDRYTQEQVNNDVMSNYNYLAQKIGKKIDRLSTNK